MFAPNSITGSLLSLCHTRSGIEHLTGDDGLVRRNFRPHPSFRWVEPATFLGGPTVPHHVAVYFGVARRSCTDERMDQLESERREKLEELEVLRCEQPDADPGSPGLLDELPVTEEQLVPAPEVVLRDLFEAFRLEVRYDKVSSWANCRVAINEEGLNGLVAHSAALVECGQHPVRPTPNSSKRSLLVRAPGKALPTSVHVRSAASRRLIIAATFEVPKSPWAR